MHFTFQSWLRISLFNLLIIASLGFLLRYKIAYSLPFIDQKHLLQGHSHFAFAGWVSQTLLLLIVAFLSKRGLENAFKKYHALLFSNLIAAYGMLICFPIQGYGLFSITFSTLSVFIAYLFTFHFWKDAKRLNLSEISVKWIKAGLVFNGISSIGAFALAYLMANKIVHQNWYLAAVYFFLHFQYNGWFFFACIGLLFALLKDLGYKTSFEKRIYFLFALACIPSYFLSTLWMKLPIIIYLIVIISATMQVIGMYYLMLFLVKNSTQLKHQSPKLGFYLIALAMLALCIKLLLQLFSTIPSLNQLAYGFRPIVIGYLHLVLLGFVSLFLLGYCIAKLYLLQSKTLVFGSITFASGIILNELLLMMQGAAAMQSISIPYSNQYLLLAACILFIGTLVIFLSLINSKSTRQTN